MGKYVLAKDLTEILNYFCSADTIVMDSHSFAVEH